MKIKVGKSCCLRPEIGIRKLIKVEILHLKYLNKYLYGFLQWEEQTRPPDNKNTNFLQKFHKVYVSADKRSSTGNLFFTDQFDNHPWEAPPELQPPGHKAGPAWPPQRRRNLSSLSGGQADQAGTKEEREDRDPAATLQAMAGE